MNKKILIAEASAHNRNVLKEILSQNSYEVVGEATSIEEALDKIKVLSPDILILDMLLPGINGVDCIKSFKSVQSEIDIILLSILGQQEMVLEGIVAGAKDFLIKPFQTDDVNLVLKKICIK
ncbi:MAG: response regulator [Synergistaceae bacterium]|nr:response regulator [Synergistaceae bacterium]